MSKLIGILTAGGDTPGLNAAIRAIGKAAQGEYGYQMIGFKDGFRGITQDRSIRLEREMLSDILTLGGTILGTSRDKPHKMFIGGKTQDMTHVIVENYHKYHLDVLVCLGGGGTQKNALRLKKKGLNIITLPKTIDNDVAETDITFGFDTALSIAAEAIDRLHTTAHSHHRIIIIETMGHKTGWIALGAGLSAGADVILIPEIPYHINIVAEAIRKRIRIGKRFSIVVIAEGAIPYEQSSQTKDIEQKIKQNMDIEEKKKMEELLSNIKNSRKDHALELAAHLELLTGLETRVTILGHLQRGGTPSAADRLLATKLGAAAADFIHQKKFGIMVAAKGNNIKAVPLEQVAGKRKTIPMNHPWLNSAKMLGTCLGEKIL